MTYLYLKMALACGVALVMFGLVSVVYIDNITDWIIRLYDRLKKRK